MNRKRLLAMLLTVAVTTSGLLVGCGKEESAGNNEAKSGESASGSNLDKDQYLNIVLNQEPKTLDPSKGTDLYSSQVLANVMEGLTRCEQDENGKDKVVAAGAEKWESNADATVWTFHLRDYKWSDGQSVTAQQFEYGVKRTLDPKVGSTYAFLLFPIKNASEYNSGKAKPEEVGVKALDDKTLQFTLKSPCPYFLDLTYFKVMEPQRQDVIEKHGDKYGTEANTMVFCGPFVISNWTHQNKVELTKNKEYWDAEKVKLDKVTMKIVKDTGSRMNELFNGALDSCPVTKPEWIKKFDATGKFNVIKGYDASTTYTFYNQKDKYFKNAKIRKAFIIAKDRENAAKTLYKGLAEPAYAWCPPQIQIGGEDFRGKVNNLPVKKLKDENQDPKKLLIEGLKEIGADPDPAKMDVKFLQAGTDADSREFAEFDQQNYKQALGVNVKVEYVEWPVFQKMTDKMEYQVAGMAWGADYNDPMTFFDMWITGAGMCPTGWASKEYDDLIKKTTATLDKNERAELFKEAEDVLVYKEGVIAPGVWRFKNTYRRKYVKNLMSPMFGVPEFKYAYTEGRDK